MRKFDLLEENYKSSKNLLFLSQLAQFVGSGQHFPCTARVVVAEVLGNNDTCADEVVVLIEKETGPGELSRGGLAKLQVADCKEISCSTLLASS